MEASQALFKVIRSNTSNDVQRAANQMTESQKRDQCARIDAESFPSTLSYLAYTAGKRPASKMPADAAKFAIFPQTRQTPIMQGCPSGRRSERKCGK
jgi:hypothetical protein